MTLYEARCRATTRRGTPCGTPLGEGDACECAHDHMPDGTVTPMMVALMQDRAADLDAARHAVAKLSMAELVQRLEMLARNPRLFGSDGTRALVERAASEIRGEWL